MNKLILKAVVALLALVLVLPGSIRAQEKKVHIKKVKEENGEKVVIDTVFTIKEGNQKMLGIPNENSTGFSITINDKSYSLRKGKIKSIEIENGVSLSLKFDGQPCLNYHLEGSSGLIPLIEGTEFGLASKFTIQKIEYI